VECVATGTDHNSRAVGQVALVDQYEQVRVVQCGALPRAERGAAGCSRQRSLRGGVSLQQQRARVAPVGRKCCCP
jgi:hypothetical protein